VTDAALDVTVRPLRLDEFDLVTGYFHGSSAEDLEVLGVDPTRLPAAEPWREAYRREIERPISQRKSYLVTWLRGSVPVGFSSLDRIRFGHDAYMHLHVVDRDQRAQGVGRAALRQTTELYFDTFALQRLYCEPNAFNVAPNRALQRVGFRYVKTHRTVPGPLNYHQAVTRWVLDRSDEPR
jgi:RimJ/RimL family protein N-acetyltransferase